MKINRAQSGYSLVEMIIYISILFMILIVVVNTVISYTRSYRTLGALRTVENSAMNAMERMTRDIRGATSIDTANSTLGSSPGVLTIVSTSGTVSTTTKFYVQGGVLKVDVNGTYFGPLTLSNASTTSLTFTRLTSTVSSAVKIDMTIDGTSGPVTKTKTYHSTIILKGQ